MDLFSDSIDGMELEVLKDKVRSIYQKLLSEYFKKQFPGASEEDIEDLTPVDASGKAPDYTGTQLGAKSKEGTKVPTGTYRGLKLGGMMTPADSQTKVRTSKEDDPTGGINTKAVDEVMVQYAPLVEKLKEELASLKQRKRIGIKEFRLG
jgi:hypothetical protein